MKYQANKQKTAAPYKKSFLKRYRWVIWIVAMLPIIYFSIQVAIILMPKMQTQVAVLTTMTDSVSVQGCVVLNSQPIQGSGVIYYTIPAGHRVPSGSEVAKVFGSEEALEAVADLNDVNSEIAILEAAQKTKAEGGDINVYLRQTQNAQMEYLNGLQKGNYSLLDEAKLEIALAGNKMQIVTGDATDFEQRIAYLNGLKQSYESMAVPISSLSAPTTGYFTPAIKNDRIGLVSEQVVDASPQELEALLATPLEYYGTDVVGHIVSDYEWRFYTVVSLKDAHKFKQGDDSLKIRFPETDSEALPVKVAGVVEDKENNIARIELVCDRMSPEILHLRTERAEIIFSEEKGVRVDKNALRIVDGQQCVYVKFGNQVYLRKIKVVLEDEHYLLLPLQWENGVNEVELYDEVVIDSGGVELRDRNRENAQANSE